MIFGAKMINNNVLLCETQLTIDDVCAIAKKEKNLTLSTKESFVEQVSKGRAALEKLWQSGAVVYGVTTGVGDSCNQIVPPEKSNDFAKQLIQFHGCGLGEYLDEITCRAILVVRLNSLKSGFSAVRFSLIEALVTLLDRNIIPRIPSEGSVGASGDLTPLSYIGAAVMGEREVYYNGKITPAKEALEAESLEPFDLQAKEALAIMNGTAVMTGIACLAIERSQNLLGLGTDLTALLTEVLHLNKAHFDRRIFEQKPHPSQLQVAARIAELLDYDAKKYNFDKSDRIQATYAIRCAPHILGVLGDTLTWCRQFVTTEINSVNDNPLIDPDTGDVLHGGNFYGGHIAMAMDSLKSGVANCADLFDRQMALLVNERRNNGLPINLSGALGEVQAINHGYKAVHIATSAMSAEALKGTMPASVFSRSTESHNQDKVSMGTISSRDAIRVLELSEQVLACTLAGAAQGLDLRIRQNELKKDELTEELQELYKMIRERVAFVEEDRALEGELRHLISDITTGMFSTPVKGN